MDTGRRRNWRTLSLTKLSDGVGLVAAPSPYQALPSMEAVSHSKNMTLKLSNRTASRSFGMFSKGEMRSEAVM